MARFCFPSLPLRSASQLESCSHKVAHPHPLQKCAKPTVSQHFAVRPSSGAGIPGTNNRQPPWWGPGKTKNCDAQLEPIGRRHPVHLRQWRLSSHAVSLEMESYEGIQNTTHVEAVRFLNSVGIRIRALAASDSEHGIAIGSPIWHVEGFSSSSFVMEMW